MMLGIDNLEKVSGILAGKRIALVTNYTGLDSRLKATADIFNENFDLRKLMAPEHGIRGDAQAGSKITSYTDPKTGIDVVSLYDKAKKPTPEMLKDIDVIAFDIQDVGSRFYTYMFTMTYCMEAAAENSKQMIVFDRPNPINGLDVEGKMLEPEYKSFIGALPITQRYGMTIGELAMYFNAEFNIGCDLTVVPLTGWERSMYFEDTGLIWVFPSPNLPTLDSASAFTATCIFEGTNVSEGRGTTKPFQLIGAPYIDADQLEMGLNDLKLPGVVFRAAYFSPYFSKHKEDLCSGVEVIITDKRAFKPVAAGHHMLYKIVELYGDKFEFLPPYKEGMKKMIELNTGSGLVSSLTPIEKVLEIYENDAKIFNGIKSKYHLYS